MDSIQQRGGAGLPIYSYIEKAKDGNIVVVLSENADGTYSADRHKIHGDPALAEQAYAEMTTEDIQAKAEHAVTMVEAVTDPTQ